ncbi:YcgN family cysteine cluster protein [Aliidiomarina indica]|uniref:YcgN family cysteine cluster protein n=1 Tax=Aliidiomarina indica TaxID=2749147 RepID=UPI00188F9D0E|nr:YcgN family cysteine cluster protein [Aliidiomarina indica]
MNNKSQPFWEHKSLAQMTREEWESLCDGCGKCCLHKLIDADEGDPQRPMSADEVAHFTHVTCQLLDHSSGRCSDYPDRLKTVPDCVVLTPDNLESIHFMPPSCAYRRLYEGHDLPSWHPLRHQGSQEAMRKAGMSIVGHRLVHDTECDPEDGEIVRWPLKYQP